MSFENFDYKAFTEITAALVKSCGKADGSIKEFAMAMKTFNDLMVTDTNTNGFVMSGEYEVQKTGYKEPEPEPEKPETFGMWS